MPKPGEQRKWNRSRGMGPSNQGQKFTRLFLVQSWHKIRLTTARNNMVYNSVFQGLYTWSFMWIFCQFNKKVFGISQVIEFQHYVLKYNPESTFSNKLLLCWTSWQFPSHQDSPLYSRTAQNPHLLVHCQFCLTCAQVPSHQDWVPSIYRRTIRNP